MPFRKKITINEILDTWESIISKVGPANDDYDRLIRHYYGTEVYDPTSHFTRNLASFFLIPIVIHKLKNKKVAYEESDIDYLITSYDKAYLLKEEDVPDDIKKEYKTAKRIINEKNSSMRNIDDYSLDEDGIKIIKTAYKKFRKYPYMILAVILHLGKITSLIKRYRPRAIVVTQAEQDFTSNMITLYCETQGVKFICVQHGEYGYNPSMAYMRFSEYYAWSEETIKILEMVNNKIDFAKIYTPNKIREKRTRKENPEYFIKYYLSGESKEEITKVKECLEMFSNNGYKCGIRRHPRVTSKEDMEAIFNGSTIELEDPYAVTLGDSISDTKYVVAYRSTVLTEAIANNMDAVVDDITQDINILYRVQDPNIRKTKMRLSDLVKQYINNK